MARSASAVPSAQRTTVGPDGSTRTNRAAPGHCLHGELCDPYEDVAGIERRVEGLAGIRQQTDAFHIPAKVLLYRRMRWPSSMEMMASAAREMMPSSLASERRAASSAALRLVMSRTMPCHRLLSRGFAVRSPRQSVRPL